MAFDIFGWLSTLCLAVSGIPQAIKTWKDGHARGLSFGMFFLWWAGEGFLLLYTWKNRSLPMFYNAILNGSIASYILWVKCFPRNGGEVVSSKIAN